MTTFFDLFVAHSSDPDVRDDPTWADRRFLELVATSPFHPWRPGEPVAAKGERILIGVATWSGYDMRLLDAIAEAYLQTQVDFTTIDVFNVADCGTSNDFACYYPGPIQITQTPTAGLWKEGQFDSFLQGQAARQELIRFFDVGSVEIVGFVNDWIKGRALAQ